MSRSLGGSGRAGKSGTESPSLNPALVAQYRDYHLGGYYNIHQLPGGLSGKSWQVTLIDADTESTIPASLSYAKVQNNLDLAGTTVSEETYWQLTLGKLFPSNISVGASINLVSQALSGADVFGYKWNGNWGLLWTPTGDLGFALVSYNFRSDYNSIIVPGTAAAANYAFQKVFRFRFDVVHPEINNGEQKFIYAFGMESEFESDLQVRFGYRKDDVLGKAYFGAGIGWNGPRLVMDYGYEKNLLSSDEYTHSFDLRLFF